MEKCISSNSVGTNAVFNFCLTNKIKLIYSATSASLGNRGKDKIYHLMLSQKQKIWNYWKKKKNCG